MSPSERIDRYIHDLADWRSDLLARVRKAMLAADPAIIEEWKWMGSPTWSCAGLVAVGNAHKGKVKLTFAHGARLEDPHGLFNGDDRGNTRRSVDIFEGDAIDEVALRDLVRAAIAYNRAHLKKNAPAVRARRSQDVS
ncbi:MAG TPA: DUF1801 domain-containing protein [Devosiaceae bacterium]|nr:DUF1801 domain-containing protein [Devosiaceae bacterium]